MGQRALNHITVRRRRKVTVHLYLALIVMQAGARRQHPILVSRDDLRVGPRGVEVAEVAEVGRQGVP